MSWKSIHLAFRGASSVNDRMTRLFNYHLSIPEVNKSISTIRWPLSDFREPIEFARAHGNDGAVVAQPPDRENRAAGGRKGTLFMSNAIRKIRNQMNYNEIHRVAI